MAIRKSRAPTKTVPVRKGVAQNSTQQMAAPKGRGNSLKTSSRATVSGPSVSAAKARDSVTDALTAKAAGTAELAATFRFNKAKAAEHSRKGPPATPAGETAEP